MRNAPLLNIRSPGDTGKEIGERVRSLRLAVGWTRKTLAERAGISLASLERLERAGKVSLDRLLRVSLALGRLDEFEKLLAPPPARSLDELDGSRQVPVRKRGRM